MAEKTVKRISTLGLLGILLSSFAYMADLIVIPAVGELFVAFHDTPMGIMNFIISGSQLPAIISALLAPVLMRFFSKKTILLVSFGAFVVIATCTGLIADPTYIAVMRGLTGACFGFTMPTAMALLIELYRDDDKLRNRYIGFFDGSMALVGGTAMIISGFLLSFGWQTVFYLYLIGVPIWIIILVFVPHTPAERKQALDADNANADSKGSKSPFPTITAIAMMLSFVMCNMIYGMIGYEYTLYLGENYPLLDSFVLGILGSTMGLAGGVLGFFFGSLFKKAKRFTISICFAAQGLAYLGLMLTFDQTMGMVWCFLMFALVGIAFGLSVPYYYAYSAVVFPERFQSFSSGLMTVGFGLGAFCSTYAVTLIMTIFGLDAYTQILPYVGVLCLIATVLSVALGIKDTRTKKLTGFGD